MEYWPIKQYDAWSGMLPQYLIYNFCNGYLLKRVAMATVHIGRLDLMGVVRSFANIYIPLQHNNLHINESNRQMGSFCEKGPSAYIIYIMILYALGPFSQNDPITCTIMFFFLLLFVPTHIPTSDSACSP